ncbi:uncharacterized protein RAG0_03428 [Rhynchosporium agropyri]|uniref:Uncharacterized protein n=1 Tax=Rhynchosporium agropyri TaxID=914238 RepID=A0A1E1K490_9HELO|nr:uncharacterized protein RAG0_03428 [Rhynchosporium agropyri]
MGANLSNLTPVDTSKAVLSSGDFDTLAIRLPILWGCSIYVMFMIMSTCMLADRWRGPRGERRLSAASVLVAMLASAAWPLVLLYLLLLQFYVHHTAAESLLIASRLQHFQGFRSSSHACEEQNIRANEDRFRIMFVVSDKFSRRHNHPVVSQWRPGKCHEME